MRIATWGFFWALGSLFSTSVSAITEKNSQNQCSDLLADLVTKSGRVEIAQIRNPEELSALIQSQASASWKRFEEHYREVTVRGLGAKLLKPRQGASSFMTNGIRLWNGHRYPFYFFKEGYVQRVRMLMEMQTLDETASATKFSRRDLGENDGAMEFVGGLESFALESVVPPRRQPRSKKQTIDDLFVFPEDHPAREIEELVLRYENYEKRLEAYTEKTEILRKRYEILSEFYEKTKDSPELYAGAPEAKGTDRGILLELPVLKRVGDSVDDEGQPVYELTTETKRFASAKAVRQNMRVLREANEEHFHQQKEGTYKEFGYMQARHFEQAYLEKQLQIFRMEYEAFSDREMSPEFVALDLRIQNALMDNNLKPTRDARLKVSRHMGVAEISFWFGRSRDLSDAGQDAMEALSRETRVKLGLSQGNLGPGKFASRVVLAAAIPFALSWYFVSKLESLKDYGDGFWKKFEDEEELIEHLASLDDEEFDLEAGRVMKFRFGAKFNDEGVLEFASDELEESAMNFSEKLREARLKQIDLLETKQESMDAFLQPAPSRPVLPKPPNNAPN